MRQSGSRKARNAGASSRSLENNYEAGEGRSHAPGRYPSPASLAGAGRVGRLPIPKQTECDSTPPDPPPAERLLKEWQNSASRMEFSVCPHSNSSGVHSWCARSRVTSPLRKRQDDGHAAIKMPLDIPHRFSQGTCTHMVRDAAK